MASETSAAKLDTFINDKYIPLDNKIKVILGIIIAVLPFVLFYFLFLGPKQEEINKLKTREKELSATVHKAQEAANNLQQHKDELADAQDLFDKISIVLPKTREISALLRMISDLGKAAGLEFVSFKPSAEVPKDFYAEIPINISIHGPYHNMGSFLYQVSKLERIVTVDNIKMSSPKEEGGEMLLDSSCNLLTYRFTDQELNSSQNNK
ncbi:MAG: pilus assembly protein PilO [Candidatus Electrothrix sp. AR3]|nr:pilus assembly protein PilO [Candidatus Electrothrix sp. AR3]